ncbi:MAG: hypothetical protein Q4F99_03370 [bacterium]|nr:hypothetical protein [bacterium]
MNRLLSVSAFLLLLVTLGCTPVAKSYLDEEALTLPQRTPVAPSLKSMDIPKKYFDEMLPSSHLYNGIGVINDQVQFQQLWALYTNDNTALPPIIDFDEEALLFVYDPNYYNFIRICGIFVYQGVAEIAIEKTDWKLSFGGNPDARRYREAVGEPNPEPKVNVSFLRVPRNTKMQPGVTAVIVGANEEDEMQSRVVPVPSRP